MRPWRVKGAPRLKRRLARGEASRQEGAPLEAQAEGTVPGRAQRAVPRPRGGEGAGGPREHMQNGFKNGSQHSWAFPPPPPPPPRRDEDLGPPQTPRTQGHRSFLPKQPQTGSYPGALQWVSAHGNLRGSEHHSATTWNALWIHTRTWKIYAEWEKKPGLHACDTLCDCMHTYLK